MNCSRCRPSANPAAVAVVCGGQSLTYGELNQRAGQLARFLRGRSVGPDGLVAVGMERSLELVVALLGILKAGGAYLPLDPSYPADRLRFMLEDSGTSLLLTRPSERQQMGDLPLGVQAVCLDTEWEEVSREQDALNPPPAATSENLAYVVYTSGSTGRPKGVQIPHRAVVNFLQTMWREPGLTAVDTLLSVTSISFDIAGLEIFLPLTTGARVILAHFFELSMRQS